MTADSEKVFGPTCTDPALVLYAREIESKVPQYVSFWNEFVGEQESDNIDTRRKQAGGSNPDVNRNYLFMQQFSYKAIWELVAVKRAIEMCEHSLPMAGSDNEHYLNVVESFSSACAAAGSCEDAVVKCLYLLDKKTQWKTKEMRSGTQLRKNVVEKLKNLNKPAEHLSECLAGFHTKHTEPLRNVLVHFTRFPGRFDNGNKHLSVVNPEFYEEDKSWGDNLKDPTKWEGCKEVGELLRSLYTDLCVLFNDAFTFLSTEIRKTVPKPEFVGNGGRGGPAQPRRVSPAGISSTVVIHDGMKGSRQ